MQHTLPKSEITKKKILTAAEAEFSEKGYFGARVDEIAVAAFLEERLSFLGISEVVSETFERLTDRRREHTLEGIISADREAREIAIKLIGEKS